jgi:hypothetical protein
MAQAGFTPLRLYSSITAAAVPTAGNLVQGELAINTNDGKLFYEDSSGVVQVLATKDAASGIFTSITDSGNLTFTGTGNRILGDFSNATVANRVAFQTSTVNGNTSLVVLPNGTATTSNIQVINNSTPTNSSVGLFSATSSEIRLTSNILGSGTLLPMTFFISTNEAMRISTAGNVGIGTASPTNKLSVVGGRTNLTANNETFALGVQYGTGAGLYYIGGTNSATPDLVFSQVGGLERMRLTNAGDLGIGTSTPAGKLQINTQDGFIFNAASSISTMRFGSALATEGTGELAFDRTAGAITISNGVTGSALTERMRIDSSGNVGIGASTPTFRLQVAGTQRIQKDGAGYEAAMLSFSTTTETGAVYRFGMASGGSFIIGRSDTSTTNITLDSSGNVGIGTNTPATYGKLAVQVNNIAIAARSGSTSYCEIAVQSGTTDAVRGQFQAIEGGIDKVIVGSRSNHPVAFTTFDTERMRIDTSANVLFGTTGVPNGTSVYGSGFIPTGSSRRELYLATDTSVASFLVRFFNPFGQVGDIVTNGAATSYNSLSDYRLKENVRPITGALDRIMQLEPSEWDWKADGSQGVGFIAHKVQAIRPQAVTGAKDAVDKDGKPQHQSMDASFLIADLTAAIQELKAEIDLLKGN